MHRPLNVKYILKICTICAHDIQQKSFNFDFKTVIFMENICELTF
jgi:hypothetical protein